MSEIDATLVYSTTTSQAQPKPSGEPDRSTEPIEASPAQPKPAPARVGEVALSSRARDGDVDAFAALVRANQAELIRMAYRMLDDRDLARSVVADTLDGAWRHLNGQPGTVTFRIEMTRAVMWRCLKTLARRRSAPDDTSPAVPAEPEEAADLDTALTLLPANDRAAWILKELHGLSDHDIAFATRVPPASVNQSVSRARQQLVAHISSTAS